LDALRSIGCWLADNWSDLGSLLFAGVVAWTAWVGVKLNRRLAEAELDPAISVYIEPDRMQWSFFDLVIKNAGRGSARNIRFTVTPDLPVEPDDRDSRLSRMAMFRDGINFMAPLQEIRTFYGSFMTLSKEPITIGVQYERESQDSKRRTVRATFVLDIAPFEGLSRVGDPPEQTVATALANIARDLQAIKSGGSNWNPTITVRRRYFFSREVNQIFHRWFGRRYLNSEDTAWRYFRSEVRQALKRSRVVRYLLQASRPSSGERE